MNYKEAVAVLSDLFHLISKEIVDINNPDLLPGEVGIHYATGSMFFCNPNTGDIISPNKADAMLQKVALRYDYANDEFDSELWGGVKLYTSFTDLHLNPGTESIEAVFATMRIPSIMITIIPDGNLNGVLPNERGGLLIIKRFENDMTMEFSDRMNFKFAAYYDNLATPKFKSWTSSGGGSGGGGTIIEAEGNNDYYAVSDEVTTYYENMTVEVMFPATNTQDPSLDINNLGPTPLGELSDLGGFSPLPPHTIIPFRYMRFRYREGKLVFLDMPLSYQEFFAALNPIYFGDEYPPNDKALWLYYTGESTQTTLIVENATFDNPEAQGIIFDDISTPNM